MIKRADLLFWCLSSKIPHQLLKAHYSISFPWGQLITHWFLLDRSIDRSVCCCWSCKWFSADSSCSDFFSTLCSSDQFVFALKSSSDVSIVFNWLTGKCLLIICLNVTEKADGKKNCYWSWTTLKWNKSTVFMSSFIHTTNTLSALSDRQRLSVFLSFHIWNKWRFKTSSDHPNTASRMSSDKSQTIKS